MEYEKLLEEAEKEMLEVKDKPLCASDGRIKGRRIALRKNLTATDKKCVLAEELGHYYTTAGNILDQSDTGNRKQEYRARIWSYDKLIGLAGILSAYRAGCSNLHEMAEHLAVKEEFLAKALVCYRSKYGICTRYENCIIYFEPCLGVWECV